MIKISKITAKEIYKRCLSLVRRKPPEFVVFAKLKICGWCIYDEDVIIIDHRKDMLKTAYHECIHYLYPDWSETQVLYAESRVINSASILDNARFLMHLSTKVYKSALCQEMRLKRARRKRKKYQNASRNNRS